jgi:flagellar basal-body rod protein FlgC
MDFLSALRISASGLAAERTRVNLASSNLANAESTRGPDGKPYKRLDPVLEAYVVTNPVTAGAKLLAPVTNWLFCLTGKL